MKTQELVERVKVRLQLNSTKHDEFLMETAPDWLEWAKGETNNLFLKNGVETLPGPVIQFVAKACEFGMAQAGLKSRSMGSVSYTYSDKLPASVTDLLRPYKKVKFHASR